MAYGNYAPFYRPGYFNPMQTQTMPNMAENQNQFSQPYQVPMQTPPMTNSAPMPSNDMIWVLGQTEAESYPVAPNATVTMWDKNQDTVYIKSVNAQGVPSMRTLDFKERTQNTPQRPAEHTCQCGDKFTPKSDFESLRGKYDDILSKISDLEEKYNILTTKTTTKTSKTAKGDVE